MNHPQPAPQINAPHLGAVDVVPAPAPLTSIAPKVPGVPLAPRAPRPAPSVSIAKSPGWAIHDLKLPREELLDAIAGMVSIPEAFKCAYIEQVNQVPAEFRFIRFDCHGQVIAGLLDQHSTAKGF